MMPRNADLSEPSIAALLAGRWEKRGLGSADIKALTMLPWSQRSYGRDAYLVREGEPTTVCTLLLSGFSFRQKLVSDGARQIISIHIPGEFVDIQNGLLDVADHNVQSLGPSTVAMVPKTALLDLIGANPAIRRAVWLDTLIDSSIFREWVVNVGRRDARARIAHLLCEAVSRLRKGNINCGPVYDFPLTQEQVADCTGLTPVHTNRTLQSLRKDGLITLSSSKLSVLDWKRLADVGDFNERYLHHDL
jgi:CRP-like cAMP-binding protein